LKAAEHIKSFPTTTQHLNNRKLAFGGLAEKTTGREPVADAGTRGHSQKRIPIATNDYHYAGMRGGVKKQPVGGR